MKLTATPMPQIAIALTRLLGRPVEDQTGLQGLWSFEIAWSPEAADTSDLPPLLTVLHEQLGLHLKSARGPAATVVVDKITQPTPD